MTGPLGYRWAHSLVVGVVLLSVLCASSASAVSTLHVDVAHGSDSGNCQSAPCQTLGYAITQAALVGGPATIDAAAGTYSEDLTLSSAVRGLSIVGAGSGSDPATNTIISGVVGANTIETADATSLTLEHLQVLNPAGDNEEAIEAPEANLSLSDVAVEQLGASGFGDGINAGGTGPASVTLSGGSVHVAGTGSEGYAINNRGGPITLTDATITVDGTGYGLNGINGVISATNTTINMADPVSAGYGINTFADIHTTNTIITVAGSGLAINDVEESTLEDTTITLTNSETRGYAVNSDSGITASGDSVTAAGSDTGLNTTGNLTITNSTITLSNTEASEAVFAAGAVTAAGDHITNAGYGCGIFAGKGMTLDHSKIEMTGLEPSRSLCGAFAGKNFEGEDDEITLAGGGGGEGLYGGSIKLTDSTILLTHPAGEAVGIWASGSASLERVTVTSALGSAFHAGGLSVVTDSTLLNAGGEPTVSLSGEGTALIRRSTVRMRAMSASPVVATNGLDLVLENSLVLGGSGMQFEATGGETDTLTVASSTIDAGELGVRDKNVNSITATLDKNTLSTALVDVQASILVEPPAARIPQVAVTGVVTPAVAVGPGGGGTVTIQCSYTEVPGVSQMQSGSAGAIECASGRDGNSFTESLAGIFAHPGTSFVLNSAWGGVDSVPAGSVSLPGGLTPSSTDLAGDPRVLNGVGSCLPGLQDRGALELTGHEGIVPIPVISGPQSVTAGSITMFTATAASTPTATFSWQSSDGASGSGASFQHAFQQAGSYTLTLRAAGAPGCTATATHTITVKAQPVPQQPATSQPAKEQAPPASPPANPPVPQFALLCANRRLTLTDVVMRGGRVLLTGAAEGRLVGKLVQIFFDGHQRVAVARVHPDGSFSAQAPMPPVGLRFSNRARYAAVADGLRSLNLKLTRRLVLDPPVAKGARVLLSGEVLQPLTRPRSEILVYREGSNCTHRVLVARVRPEANGHYRLMLRAPAGRAATVYRLSSRVRANTHSSRTFQTFSLTESVRLH